MSSNRPEEDPHRQEDLAPRRVYRRRRQLPISFSNSDSPCTYRNQFRVEGKLEIIEIDKVNRVHLVWHHDGLPEIGYIYAVRVQSDAGIGELMAILENCANCKLMGVSMAAGHWHGEYICADLMNDWWLRLWVEQPWTPEDIFKRILANKH